MCVLYMSQLLWKSALAVKGLLWLNKSYNTITTENIFKLNTFSDKNATKIHVILAKYLLNE